MLQVRSLCVDFKMQEAGLVSVLRVAMSACWASEQVALSWVAHGGRRRPLLSTVPSAGVGDQKARLSPSAIGVDSFNSLRPIPIVQNAMIVSTARSNPKPCQRKIAENRCVSIPLSGGLRPRLRSDCTLLFPYTPWIATRAEHFARTSLRQLSAHRRRHEQIQPWVQQPFLPLTTCLPLAFTSGGHGRTTILQASVSSSGSSSSWRCCTRPMCALRTSAHHNDTNKLRSVISQHNALSRGQTRRSPPSATPRGSPKHSTRGPISWDVAPGHLDPTSFCDAGQRGVARRACTWMQSLVLAWLIFNNSEQGASISARRHHGHPAAPRAPSNAAGKSPSSIVGHWLQDTHQSQVFSVRATRIETRRRIQSICFVERSNALCFGYWIGMCLYNNGLHPTHDAERSNFSMATLGRNFSAIVGPYATVHGLIVPVPRLHFPPGCPCFGASGLRALVSLADYTLRALTHTCTLCALRALYRDVIGKYEE
ncbi:hypothetical protein FA95DRAFT_1599185 [Auriscalpium vulgare]|uniref:Uncharacterized protein n=1 Tax=Auriscalpium vulgare TaxID=40419 RepID=A0ACB8R9Y0_9AGAM|nr:hypothetical protein FA95DRAFT_1599185 [Auriscalpium vulgare]